MTHKINLHQHTNYSDGFDPVSVNILECQRLGFSACCITDHLYLCEKDKGRCIDTFTKYARQWHEIKRLSHYLNYPVIQGCELQLVEEELVIFGREFIFAMIRWSEENNPTYDELVDWLLENKPKYKHVACFIPHPRMDNELWKKLTPILDGFEIVNAGNPFFSEVESPYYHELLEPAPEEWKDLTRLQNSDAHCVRDLNEAFNETKQLITSEKGVIAYIKGRIK